MVVYQNEAAAERARRKAQRNGYPDAEVVGFAGQGWVISLTASHSLFLYSGGAARPMGFERRNRLASLRSAGMSVSEIAVREGVSTTSIYKALQRQRKEAQEYMHGTRLTYRGRGWTALDEIDGKVVSAEVHPANFADGDVVTVVFFTSDDERYCADLPPAVARLLADALRFAVPSGVRG